MRSTQLESLHRELADARWQAVQLKEKLDVIEQSPGWRLITTYRKWLNKGRATTRIIDGAARLGIRLFSSPGAKDPPAAAPPAEAVAASPREQAARGTLIHCLDPGYMGRVFYCRNGKRHWIRSREHITCYDPSLDYVVLVNDEEMRRYELAAPLPLPWSEADWANPVRRDPSTSREIATSRNRGSGIEFGAGTSPMSMPLGCEVKYADYFSEGDLKGRAYQQQGTDFVRLSYEMGMEDMSAVPDGSLDFVNACHVIEHLRNPLRAFEQVYRKLKPGGRFVLVVPDMRRMFDCHRAMTTLEHLVADYKDPGKERDLPHYFEFFSKVYNVPDAVLAARVETAVAGNEDLHFHTWTYESFGAMVEYIQREMAPWSSVWSQTYVEEEPGWHEFYFVLEK